MKFKIKKGDIFKHRTDRQYIYILKIVKKGYYKTALIYNGRLHWESEIVHEEYIKCKYYNKPYAGIRVRKQFDRFFSQ